jgi:hypothetical protein
MVSLLGLAMLPKFLLQTFTHDVLYIRRLDVTVDYGDDLVGPDLR